VRRHPHSDHGGFWAGQYPLWGCRVGASRAEETHRRRRPPRVPCTERPMEGDQRFSLAWTNPSPTLEVIGRDAIARVQGCQKKSCDPITFPRLTKVVAHQRDSACSEDVSPPSLPSNLISFAHLWRRWHSSGGCNAYPEKRCRSGRRLPHGWPTASLSARAAAAEDALASALLARHCRTCFSGCNSTPRTKPRTASCIANSCPRVGHHVGTCGARRVAPARRPRRKSP